MTTRLTSLLLPLLAVISATIVLALGLRLAGIDAIQVFKALWLGAAGDSYRLSETAVKACPLLLTGLAVALALQAGLWNIGAEGQLLLGAIATVWIGHYIRDLPPPLALTLVVLASLSAGLLWAACAVYLKQKHHVNEVISTIMLNFIAVYLLSYAVHGPLTIPTNRSAAFICHPPSALSSSPFSSWNSPRPSHCWSYLDLPFPYEGRLPPARNRC